MVSRRYRDGGMACVAGDFCFVRKAGMGPHSWWLP